jgi:3'-phosphoadenosine 5'-phosphosulfate sulfotransferase (PAPS reductase)/FAD synthetase
MHDLQAIERETEPHLAELPGHTGQVDLHDYDEVIVNSSGGKDSLVIKYEVWRQALAQGYPLNQITVQYNALGDRVTWPGTRSIGPNAAQLVAAFGDRPGTAELVAEQCAVLGLQLFVTRRASRKDPDEQDLLDHIARHGRFPDSGRRFCTSDHKRGPGQKHITARYTELGLDRPARILYVFGFRRDESPKRAGYAPFTAGANVNSRRVVDQWYPVHHWTDAEVWACIRDNRLPYHWAYDAGMRRLSCSFCVLAGGEDLVLAAALRPDVAAAYLAVEQANLARGRAAAATGDQHAMTGRTFQKNRTMAQIIAEARTHPVVQELGLGVP